MGMVFAIGGRMLPAGGTREYSIKKSRTEVERDFFAGKIDACREVKIPGQFFITR